MRKFILICLFLAAFILPAKAEIVIQKNVAYTDKFNIWKNDGTVLSGAAGLDSEISTRDAGGAWSAYTDCTNEASEDGSTGSYTLVIAQAETNHEWIRVQVKSSTTGAVVRFRTYRTTIGNPQLMASTDDGGPINVTGGVVDTVGTVNGLANNVITANAINTGAITNAKFASGAIDAAAIAADAIGGSELAADAGTEIGTAVWANATRTLSAGAYGGLTAADIDAIWDELASGHTTAGTFGRYLDKQISTIDDNPWDNATRTLTAGTNIALAKGTGITGFNDLDAAGVAGAVWNAATASYGTAGTYGLLVETDLDATISSRGTGTSTLTAQQVWEYATRTITAGAYAGLTAADIDAIWDELQAGHTNAGTFGKYLDAQSSTIGGGSLTVEAIADGVWDEILSGHSTAGSAGKALTDAGEAGSGGTTVY